MTEFKKHEKIFSNLSNSGRTFKFTDRDRLALECIVRRKHQTTAAKVTAELNQHLNSPVRPKLFTSEEVEVVSRLQSLVCRPMDASDILRRVPFFSFPNCRASLRVEGRESYNPDCLLPTVNQRGASVMVCAVISWSSPGSIVALHGTINSKDYLNIL